MKMFCQKCGRPMDAGAVYCQNCGWQSQNGASLPSAPVVKPRKQKKKGVIIVLIAVIAVAVLLLGSLAAVILIRSDLTMKDLTEKPTHMEDLFKFGIPTRRGYNSNETWVYENCITLHGVAIGTFEVDFDKEEYKICDFDETQQAGLERIIERYCDLDHINSLCRYYTYEDLELAAYDNFWLVIFEPFK